MVPNQSDAVLDDAGDVGEGFDVVDDGGLAEEALDGGKGGLLRGQPPRRLRGLRSERRSLRRRYMPLRRGGGSNRRRTCRRCKGFRRLRPLISPCLPKTPWAYASWMAFSITLAWW